MAPKSRRKNMGARSAKRPLEVARLRDRKQQIRTAGSRRRCSVCPLWVSGFHKMFWATVYHRRASCVQGWCQGLSPPDLTQFSQPHEVGPKTTLTSQIRKPKVQRVSKLPKSHRQRKGGTRLPNHGYPTSSIRNHFFFPQTRSSSEHQCRKLTQKGHLFTEKHFIYLIYVWYKTCIQ